MAINKDVALLEIEHPPLQTLTKLGAAVVLPWYVTRDTGESDFMPTKAA